MIKLYRVPQSEIVLDWSEIKRTVCLYTRKDKSLGDIKISTMAFFVSLGKDRKKRNVKEDKSMQWIFLLAAGVFEVLWAVELKFSEGFTKLWPSVITVLGMIASFYFLSLALKSLQLGTAYAIWTGIGTVGTVLLGVLLFKEPANLSRIIFISLIVAGIIGLKLTSSN